MKKIIIMCLILITINSAMAAKEQEPTVALVLSGGGALGFAHVGVLKVLEEVGIFPDMVIGTSMGSIVGAMYCIGYSSAEMEQILLETDWKETMLDSYDRRELSFEKKQRQSRYYFSIGETDNSQVGEAGFSHAQHVVEFIDGLLVPYCYELDFDELPVPFRAVGTDLLTGEEVVFSEGDLKTVIRASMAVPGVFTPVDYEGKFVIDGGWVDNLPTKVARDLGADIIIAISLYSLEDDINQLDSPVAVTAQADIIRTNDLSSGSFDIADIVISPDLSNYNQADFEMAGPMIEIGYQAGDGMRAELRDLAETILSSGKIMKAPEGQRGDVRVSLSKIILNNGNDRERENGFIEKFESELGYYPLMSEIQEFLYRQYDGGDYYHVWYQLIPSENGEFDLLIEAPLKEEDFQRFSASVDASTQIYNHVLTEFAFKSSYQRLIGDKKDSSLSLDFQLSPYPSGTISFDHNLLGKELIVGSEIYALQNPEYYYGEGSVESIYTLLSLGGALFMEQPLFDKLNFALSIYGESDSSDFRMGAKKAEEESWIDIGVKAEISIDTLDRVITPTSGVNAFFLLDSSYDFEDRPLGYLRVAGEAYIPMKDKEYILCPQYELQTLLWGNSRSVDRPVLGGAIDFDGYYYQELRSDNLGLFALSFRKRVGRLPLGFGEDIYLQARGNGAALWKNETLEEDKSVELFWGASGGVVVSSSIGEVSFDICTNQDGRVSVELSLSTSTSFSDAF